MTIIPPNGWREVGPTCDSSSNDKPLLHLFVCFCGKIFFYFIWQKFPDDLFLVWIVLEQSFISGVCTKRRANVKYLRVSSFIAI